MDEVNKYFSKYIEEFNKLNISSKKNEVLNSIKELIAVIDILASKDNIKLEYLKSSHINKIDSEDDFLETLLIYIEESKNLLGQYLDNK